MTDEKKQEPQGKSFANRVMGTFSLLFSSDADPQLAEIFKDENSPSYQKVLAIWESGLKKRKTLRKDLITIVTDPAASRNQRLAAIHALAKIGDLFSEDVPTNLLVKLIDLYLNTWDTKIYTTLYKLFLAQKSFPVVLLMTRTLLETFDVTMEISTQAWEILSRALHLCFSFQVTGAMQNLEDEMKRLVHHKDIQREKVEKMAYAIKSAVICANNVRSELIKNLKGDSKGEALIAMLSTLALNISYHDKCEFPKKLKPLLECLIDSRPGIRLLAQKELEEIPTPVAYDHYRSLILKEIPGFADTPRNVITLLGTMAAKDGEALEIFLSLSDKILSDDAGAYSDEMVKIFQECPELRPVLVHHAMDVVEGGEASERILLDNISRIIGVEPSSESIHFLISTAQGEDTALSTRKRAMKVLLQYNNPEFADYKAVSGCIKFLSQEGTNQELKQFIFNEVRESPLEENVGFLKEGIFDENEEVRKGALRSFCEMIKSGKVEREDGIGFFTVLLDSNYPARSDIKLQTLIFLKSLPIRDGHLRGMVYELLGSEEKEIRNQAFEVVAQWLVNALAEEEEKEILNVLYSILTSPEYRYEDSYLRVAKLVSDGIADKVPVFEKWSKETFVAIEQGLSRPLSMFQNKILCEILDNSGSGKNPTARVQANWIMENLLRNQHVSPIVHLHILQFLIHKEGKMIQFFPRLLALLSLDDQYIRKVSLEILAGESATFQKFSVEEKLKAFTSPHTREMDDYIKWELMLNKHLLPILVSLLRDPATEQETIILIISIIRRIECAREYLSVLFEFQNPRYGDAIREKALESIAYLLYPPFIDEEKVIIDELMRIASDGNAGANYRLSSLHALVYISVEEFYDFFISLATNESERPDIRMRALQGLNSIRNPQVVGPYITLLRNPRYGSIHRETILDGFALFGLSYMIDALLTIIFGGEGTKLVEKARTALLERSYGEAIEIRTSYRAIQDLRYELDEVDTKLLSIRETEARTRKEVESQRKEIERREVEIAQEEQKHRQDDEARQNELRQGEQLKQKYDARFRELAPEWPNERKVPPDLREPLRKLKEQYAEFALKYQSMKETQELEREREQQRIDERTKELSEIKEKEADGKSLLQSLVNESTLLEAKKVELESRIEQNERETKAKEISFRESLPEIDRKNLESIQRYREERVNEWKNRWEYFHRVRNLTSPVV